MVAKKNLECELNAVALLTAAWRHERGAADGEAAAVARAQSQQESHLLPHLQKQAWFSFFGGWWGCERLVKRRNLPEEWTWEVSRDGCGNNSRE